jgi:MoaA/NifB/PqqE/SkfB family radical SAM enzyme
METTPLQIVVSRLSPYFKIRELSPFNYVPNLVATKSAYLTRFLKNEPFPPFEVEIQMSSKCNLRCQWCIGSQVQEHNRVESLPDKLHAISSRTGNRFKIEDVVHSIIDYKENGLGVEIVKFSGFIGEPLLYKKETLRAIQILSNFGIKVGLFTNGIFMDEDTWEILSNILYVNVSLDAGPRTYSFLKEGRTEASSDATFKRIIENIHGLHVKRKGLNSKVNITASYVVVPENQCEIFEASRAVKEAGADEIRFKCDIGGRHDIAKRSDTLDKAFEQLKLVERNLAGTTFHVAIIHEKDDMVKAKYNDWTCSSGCWYQLFVGTIGSNGTVYLCDHNTMPGAFSFGDVIDGFFEKIWKGSERQSVINDIPNTCKSSVCPPFANAINGFLDQLVKCKNDYGVDIVLKALLEFQ